MIRGELREGEGNFAVAMIVELWRAHRFAILLYRN